MTPAHSHPFLEAIHLSVIVLILIFSRTSICYCVDFDFLSIHLSVIVLILIFSSQTCVTSELEGGDRSKAMKRLRVPPLGEQVSHSGCYLLSRTSVLKGQT